MNRNQEKTNDKKERGRWSAVDVIVILLILAAIGGIVYRVFLAVREEPPTQPDMYAVYFEVAETYAETLKEVRGFDAVYLYENNRHLGYVAVYEDVTTGEYRVALNATPTGTVDMATATGCMICTNGTLSEGGLLVDGSGYYLTPGAELTVCTERALLTLRITEIKAHN